MRPWQRGLIICALALSVLLLLWHKYSEFLEQGSRPPQGTLILNEIEKTGVPDIKMKDINGEPFELNSVHDHVVIVNFWASWCKPCMEEFPSMLALLKEFKSNLTIVALTHDYEMEDIRTFLKAYGAENLPNFVVLWDKDKKVADAFGTKVLPESYIVGKGGVLIRKVSGVENWASPDALQFFKDLVAGSYPARGNKPDSNVKAGK